MRILIAVTWSDIFRVLETFLVPQSLRQFYLEHRVQDNDGAVKESTLTHASSFADSERIGVRMNKYWISLKALRNVYDSCQLYKFGKLLGGAVAKRNIACEFGSLEIYENIKKMKK